VQWFFPPSQVNDADEIAVIGYMTVIGELNTTANVAKHYGCCTLLTAEELDVP